MSEPSRRAAEVLQSLNFHDSTLVGTCIQFSAGRGRSCKIDLDYYDWEGNAARRALDPHAAWQHKRLQLTFGFLAHFEFYGPDLVNRAQDLERAEVGYRLAEFLERAASFKRQFPHGSYPLFSDQTETVSLRLVTHNNDASSDGYLWIVGSSVALEWGESNAGIGQIHFPLAAGGAD